MESVTWVKLLKILTSEFPASATALQYGAYCAICGLAVLSGYRDRAVWGKEAGRAGNVEWGNYPYLVGQLLLLV